MRSLGDLQEKAVELLGHLRLRMLRQGTLSDEEAVSGNPVEGVSPEELILREVQEAVDKSHAVEADRILSRGVDWQLPCKAMCSLFFSGEH